jgi:hypothetical protein
LGAAGVLDCLGGEEEVLGWVGDVGSVWGGCGCCCWGLVTEVFEEEDYAVDWAVIFWVFIC